MLELVCCAESLVPEHGVRLYRDRERTRCFILPTRRCMGREGENQPDALLQRFPDCDRFEGFEGFEGSAVVEKSALPLLR